VFTRGGSRYTGRGESWRELSLVIGLIGCMRGGSRKTGRGSSARRLIDTGGVLTTSWTSPPPRVRDRVPVLPEDPVPLEDPLPDAPDPLDGGGVRSTRGGGDERVGSELPDDGRVTGCRARSPT
jgi:hypothetical protein